MNGKWSVTLLLLFVLAMNITVAQADDMNSPLDICNFKGEVVVSLDMLGSELVEKLGNPWNYYEPSVIFESDQLTVPTIEIPVQRGNVEHIDALKALYNAVPNEWDVLDEQSASMALEPFGITIEELWHETGDDRYYRIEDLNRGRLDHEFLEMKLQTAEIDKELYDMRLANYYDALETPYEDWIELVESSLVITEGMLNMMLQDGSLPLYSAVYEGLTITWSNEYTELGSFRMDQSFIAYMTDKLVGNEYRTVEERNIAIGEALTTYQKLYQEQYYKLLEVAKVGSVRLLNPGFQTGTGDYVGKPVEADRRWVYSYYSHGMPLSTDYIDTLSADEKAGIDGLMYCVANIDEKGFISEIDISIYETPKTQKKPLDEATNQTENQETLEERLVDDLLHGFTDRDAFIRENPDVDSYSLEKYVNTYKSYVEAECSYLDKYRDEQFSDEIVAQAVSMYISGLDEQVEALSQSLDNWNWELFFQTWDDGYTQRCRALFLLSQEYDLRVRLSLQNTLNDMIAYGEQLGK